MSQVLPLAPPMTEAPIPAGTWVVLDDHARFLDRDLLSGGAPWRLLRLPGGSRVVADRWRGGDEVRVGEERFARTLVHQGLLHPVYRHEPDGDDVDVVIPVLDDVESLRSLLTSLRGLHVTVVDDGSVDGAAIATCAAQFEASLIRLDQNRGPAAARNAGVLATSRPFIWFLDVDVEVGDADDVLVRLRRQFADPLLSAIAPRVTGEGGPSLRDRFERRFSPLDMGTRSSLVVPGAVVGYVPSASLLVRRSSFGEGYDETMRVGEDVDLVWRLHDHGWLVRYDATIAVTHRARPTWPLWWRQRVSYGTSASELAVRHGARMAPLRSDVWTFVAWTSAAIGQPIIGARIVRTARDRLSTRFADSTDDPDRVAGEVVVRGMLMSAGPLARAAVRTFGPLLLVGAIHPKLRRGALGVYAVGTAWRWRASRVRPDEVALGVADDLAYGVGVYQGAWRAKSVQALKPHFTASTLGLREVLGLKSRRSN